MKLNPELPYKSSIQQEEDSFHQQTGLNLRKKLMKCYIWSTALQGAETWTLHRVDQKYIESFEILCLRILEKIILTDVKN